MNEPCEMRRDALGRLFVRLTVATPPEIVGTIEWIDLSRITGASRPGADSQVDPRHGPFTLLTGVATGPVSFLETPEQILDARFTITLEKPSAEFGGARFG